MHIRNHRSSIRNCCLGVRNHGVSIRDRYSGIGNQCLSIYNRRSGIRNHRLGIRYPDVGIDRQFRLKWGPLSLRIPKRTNWTHIEYVENSDKILVPRSNLILVALREDEPQDYVPFPSFVDLPPHLGHGSVINTWVNGSLIRITGLTHVVSSPIASNTAWVSSSNRFPVNLRCNT
jgi:hypothetical protein